MACVAEPADETSLASPYLVTINIQAEQQQTSSHDDAVQPTQVSDCCPAIEDLDSSVITNWTRPMVLLLIKSYEERKTDFKDPTKKKKLLWIEIARVMRCHGYTLTWDACDKKWRNLKKTYCNIVNHNRKTVHGGQSWEYLLQMKEILGNNDGNEEAEKSILQPSVPDVRADNRSEESVPVDNTTPHITSSQDLLIDANNVNIEEKQSFPSECNNSEVGSAASRTPHRFSTSSQRIVKQILSRVRPSPSRRKVSSNVRRVAGLPYNSAHPTTSTTPSWVEQYLKKQGAVELSRLEVMHDLRTMMREYVQTQKERNEVLKRFAIAVEKLAEK